MLNQIIILCLVILCSFGEDNYREVLDLPEGSKCRFNGLDGKCTNILYCQSAKDNLRQGIHPYICSFQGKTPIVCCTNCLPNHNRTNTTDFEVGSRFEQSESKARNYCLKYLETLAYPCKPFRSLDRTYPENNSDDYVVPSLLADAEDSPPLEELPIGTRYSRSNKNVRPWPPLFKASPAVGAGVPALRNQYPHMALLGYGDDIQSAQWLCGGSVISEKYILTAAHCISSPAVGSVTFIRLGILRRSDPPEFWQTHKVKRVIGHPEYSPPSKYNDIALLETDKPISFSINVLPACLPLGPETGETAEATGWGALGHRLALADTLQTVKLQRYDKEKCSQLYPKHRHLRKGYDHATQMCYGDKDLPKDTCEGDSGGPLQIPNEFKSCAYTIIGVTSYGRQCGVSGSGMYTRVYYYVPWIESIVWP